MPALPDATTAEPFCLLFCPQEALYEEDMGVKAAAAAAISQLFRSSSALGLLQGHPTLLQALARLLREDAKHSAELCISLLTVFCALSHLPSAQALLVQVGCTPQACGQFALPFILTFSSDSAGQLAWSWVPALPRPALLNTCVCSSLPSHWLTAPVIKLSCLHLPLGPAPLLPPACRTRWAPSPWSCWTWSCGEQSTGSSARW